MNAADVRITSLIVAGWSSQVAREAHNLEVVGSNPAPAIFQRIADEEFATFSPLSRVPPFTPRQVASRSLVIASPRHESPLFPQEAIRRPTSSAVIGKFAQAYRTAKSLRKSDALLLAFLPLSMKLKGLTDSVGT